MKILIPAILIGAVALIYFKGKDLFTKGVRFFEEMEYKITSFSLPRLGGGMLQVPITMLITNPVPGLTFTVNRFQVDFFVAKGNRWEQVGTVVRNEPVRIVPGPNKVTLHPSLDLSRVFTDVGSSIMTAMSGSLPMMFHIKGNIEGIPASYKYYYDVPLY